MQHEVIVVGGGIGGLTTAALLAARGIDVCLLERQSAPGGCVANFERLGYSFEPTAGLYSGWEHGGTWERVFRELPVAPPPLMKLSPNYVVRLPDRTDIAVTDDQETLESNLAASFPDYADAAIGFFRTLGQVAQQNSGDSAEPLEMLLTHAPHSFRLFLDAQLQTFAQRTSADCSMAQAAAALRIAVGALYSIGGGGQALADGLAASLRSSGGSLRLNSTVLRLAYGSDGEPIGVDLLSGERIHATRAVVSNLTVWDTYGKLIGLNRAPKTMLSQLRKLTACGAYLIFISVDEDVAADIPSRQLLVFDSELEDRYDPTGQQLFLNLATADTARAPAGKTALTAWTFTNAEDWFSFHEDSAAHEKRDQAELETWWVRLHSAMPELGDRAEVIETATPQTFYETTRRKLGMIGAPLPAKLPALLPFPNLFVVSDTNTDTFGVEGVARSALRVVDSITK